MSEPSEQTAAKEKYACPACGAQAEWNPAKQKLVCPFCGTESARILDRTTGQAAEIDLLKALSEIPEEERGWNTARSHGLPIGHVSDNRVPIRDGAIRFC